MKPEGAGGPRPSEAAVPVEVAPVLLQAKAATIRSRRSSAVKGFLSQSPLRPVSCMAFSGSPVMMMAGMVCPVSFSMWTSSSFLKTDLR